MEEEQEGSKPGSPEFTKLLDRFFEEPGGHVILDSDLRIVEVGPEYVRLTMGRREDLMGKLYVNTITDPDSARHETSIDNIRRLSAAAFKTHLTQKYPATRMDIRAAEDGHVEERWWRGAYIPVIGEDGVGYLVHRIEDVTQEKVTARQLDAQRRSNYILYGLVVFLLGVSLWIFVSRSKENHGLAFSTCQQVQRINSNIYKTFQGELYQLNTPGTGIYNFYRKNPDLIPAAKQQFQNGLKTFAPKQC